MSELKKRLRRDQDAFAQLLEWVPGFQGYREQSARRDADRLLRGHLVRLLSETQEKVRRRMEDMSKQGSLKGIGLLDSISKRLEKLADLIRYADAGCSGWFDAVKIREEDLDRLYEYDLSLRQFIIDVDSAVMGAVAEAGDTVGALDRVSAALDELEYMIRNRKQVALGLIP